MRWLVILIGIVLFSGVTLFAIVSESMRSDTLMLPEPDIMASSTFFGSTASSAVITSGVRGTVRVQCPVDSTDSICPRQIRTIEAFQGVSPVALFKTDINGSFQVALPAGTYELRVDVPTSTRCVSVGVVVPDEGVVSTNISCTLAE